MSGRRPSNAEIARALREMAMFLEMDEVPFKPAAYERAADAVESLGGRVADLHARGGLKALGGIGHVGKGIARRIEALITTGRIPELEDLRHRTPVDLLELTRLEGVGPKMARALYQELGVRTLQDLETACRGRHLRHARGFGEKTEQKLLRGLERLQRTGGRIPLGAALPLAARIERSLAELPFVTRVATAGSIRRRKETIGDLDFLAVSTDPARLRDFFTALPDVEDVHASGESKVMVRLQQGLDADLRIVPDECFGAALLYFTGSKDHNVALRKIAIERDLKLNEYGVFSGETSLAAKTEEEVYGALGLPFIPPELREHRGEIEAARAGELPELIAYGALRGDLQVQTDWTDGASSIEEMARAAQAMGYEYIAITDHTRDLGMARGSTEARILEQVAAIDQINTRLTGFRILSGAEVNIRRDGSLDIADETLARLDVVGAAIHHFFNLTREEMTERMLRVIENPHVDIVFHPTARSLGKRDEVDVDLDRVMAAAARTGTVLEIDALPDRLDLRDELVRKAIQAGVKLAVDSDAHQVSDFAYADTLGVATARRGWATRADVINTRSAGDMLALLKGGGA
ncbi:MAG: DNA polymerase/3'-5' exonuclease PolX [Deltaproteobacteria bacterium]|nr:DNA polymerase/3'-5' exonuclease PolX [Deltaproteobacteria bacterium]